MSNVFTITTELKLNREYNQLVGKYISDYIELFNKIQRLTFHRVKNYYIKNGKITLEDRNIIHAQLKEEFIDIIIIVALSEDELEKVQKAIFNDKLDNLLKNMFQKKKESRKYARDFIEKHVESVIKDRERITEKEILEAVEISKNVFVV